MATIHELGLRLGDWVTIPNRHPEDPEYSEEERHVAQIVGPPGFPKADVIYLAPPREGNTVSTNFYNPTTGKARPTWVRVFENNRYVRQELSPKKGEIRVEVISNTGYTLFERA